MLDQRYDLRHLHDDLASEIRRLMLAELLCSLENNRLYFSRNFSEPGQRLYPTALRDALAAGTPDTLDDALGASEVFRSGVARRSAQAFIWDEFNKYYMRAACQWVREHPGHELVVVRGRQSSSHRGSSDAQIGRTRDPVQLLQALRTVPKVNPFGANSGLTLTICKSASKAKEQTPNPRF